MSDKNNDTDNLKKEEKKKRVRSTNFPGVSLRVAVEKTSELYQKVETHEALLTTVANTWNYSTKSSGLTKVLGALGAYGLVEIEGSKDARRIKVSKDGERIVENGPGYENLLKQSAMRPKIFSQVINKYSQNGHLPPDDVLKERLRWDEEIKFNKETIDRFIANLKETITYANLKADDIMASNEAQDTRIPEENYKDLNVDRQLDEPKVETHAGTYQTGTQKMKQYPIPLGGGADAVLAIPQPMTARMYEKLKKVINLYEDVLVSQDEPAELTEEPEELD